MFLIIMSFWKNFLNLMNIVVGYFIYLTYFSILEGTKAHNKIFNGIVFCKILKEACKHTKSMKMLKFKIHRNIY